jgi:hypothetical protein
VEPGAVGLVEHETVVDEVGADEEALFGHALAVITQDGDGASVQFHWATPSDGLRFALADLANLDHGLDDVGLAFVEIDVLPT